MHRLSGPTGLLIFLAATLLAAVDANAQTRTERFRWTHATPSVVAGFKLYYGTTSGVHTQQINVNLPPRDASNAYYVDVVVPQQNPVYAVVTAYNAQGESAKSNEKFRPGSGTPPPPPPPPSGALSALTGFVLWNAQTDSAVDTSFVSGERIDLKTLPCTAIQIKTNSYLNTRNTPGSVKRVFDGKALACTSASAGTSHENNPPYAWEADNGGNYECAPTLTAVGSHTLTAIPYDGDNCTGLAGASATLTFEIVNTAPLPPPPVPLGQPGQPQLVP